MGVIFILGTLNDNEPLAQSGEAGSVSVVKVKEVQNARRWPCLLWDQNPHFAIANAVAIADLPALADSKNCAPIYRYLKWKDCFALAALLSSSPLYFQNLE